MRILKEEKGFITVALLAMIFIIVTVMGAGIVFINSGNKRAWLTARSNQALYLAEAGIEKAIQDLKNNPEQWDSPPNPTSLNFPPTNPIGTYEVKFESQSSPNKWIIKSTGATLNGNTEKIYITLNKEKAGEKNLTLELALFTYNTINMGSSGSSQIFGNVGTYSNAENTVHFPRNDSAKIEGILYIGSEGIPEEVVYGGSWSYEPWRTNVTGGTIVSEKTYDYSDPAFPDYPADLPTRSSITLQGITNGRISEDGYYPSIKIDNNTTLTIDIPEGTERKIMVDTLDMPVGNIIINGSGKLILYIKNTFNFKSSSKINYGTNGEGDPNNLMLYYNGGNTFSTGGDTKINGTLFVNSANINITNSGAIKGNIITKGPNVSISGAGQAMVGTLYAPNANVSLTNSGTVNGAVVAKSFNASGNSRIHYTSENSTITIPVGEGTSNSIKIIDWKSSGFESAE